MEGYLTVGEAAEKWGVSEGRICQYSLRGRIPGAKRLGGAWVIPESADRPSGSQPAKPGKTPELFSHLMPLMNTPFSPGQCRQAIADMKAGPKRDIALAEEMPPAEDFLPLLPPGLRAFALYVQARYLYLKGEYGRSVGVVEATLTMGAHAYPISAIYLHLVGVMSYMSLKQTDRAREHLLEAWELARPDDLIEGFGEHHGLLGAMLEATIKPEWPEDFRRIIDITYRFSSGWRRVHNPVTGHDVADDLTTTEFAIAMLAARGWTTQEIGDHLNISANTVKAHISQAMKKLNVKNRKDLKKHMLR